MTTITRRDVAIGMGAVGALAALAQFAPFTGHASDPPEAWPLKTVMREDAHAKWSNVRLREIKPDDVFLTHDTSVDPNWKAWRAMESPYPSINQFGNRDTIIYVKSMNAEQSENLFESYRQWYDGLAAEKTELETCLDLVKGHDKEPATA